MLKLSANVSLLFSELPFLERFQAASAAGFYAVEAMYPYEFSAQDIAREMRASDLQLSVINLPPGDSARAEKGLAALGGRERDFEQSLEKGLEYASALECQRVHLLTGNLPAGVALHEIRPTLIRNIERALRYFEPHGIVVLLEPLSRQMLPHYSLTRVEQAVALIDDIGSPDLRLQLDLYHTQMEQGNLAALIERYQAYIDYIQIAGVPGRHEPTVGEINYAYLLKMLEDRQFIGWVGCEYVPQGDTRQGLQWARDWGLLPQERVA
ncbi:TIM barrel protein [Bordetella sp. 15P40C-2]|uniref:hydroxypyruvate isomerase family protein n=1 Tax=Bordetella sp. 15P40C-2 TaxID=2572246 RepID=UPI001365411D